MDGWALHGESGGETEQVAWGIYHALADRDVDQAGQTELASGSHIDYLRVPRRRNTIPRPGIKPAKSPAA